MIRLPEGCHRIHPGAILSVPHDGDGEYLVEIHHAEKDWIVHRPVGRDHVSAADRFVVTHAWTGLLMPSAPMPLDMAKRLATALAEQVPSFRDAPGRRPAAKVCAAIDRVVAEHGIRVRRRAA